MTYDHKGVEIKFLEGPGKFEALINGVPVLCPSLTAIRKKIDNAGKTTFKPFEAYVYTQRRERIVEKIKIVGIQPQGRGRYSRNPRWISEDKNGATRVIDSYNSVMELSAKNLTAIKALAAHEDETRKIETKRNVERMRLEKQIVLLLPEKYKA